MTDEEKVETGVTEDNYASMLGDAIKTKDAEINSLKIAQAKRIKELTDLVVNGQQAEEEPKDEEVLESRIDLYKKYRENKFNTDLDFWKNFLELRDATIREYGKDPLVTGNYGFDIDGNHVDCAVGEEEDMDSLCETIKTFIEESNGDPNLFNLKIKTAIKK